MKCHMKLNLCSNVYCDAHQMYYVDVIDVNEWISNQFDSFNNKVMEVYCKEHIIMFHKQLPMWNPTFDIKVHHDVNLKLKMLMQKVQMLFLLLLTMNQRSIGLSNGTNLQSFVRHKKFSCRYSQMPLLINDVTRPFFGTRLKDLFNISLTFVQSIAIHLKCALFKIVHSCNWSSKRWSFLISLCKTSMSTSVVRLTFVSQWVHTQLEALVLVDYFL
jgi:hypothetical protein